MQDNESAVFKGFHLCECVSWGFLVEVAHYFGIKNGSLVNDRKTYQIYR